MKSTMVPTLGESVDHYGEEYCTHAVNMYQQLLKVLKCMNHVEEAYCICPANDGYLPYEKHATICVMAQKAIAKAEGR